MARVTVEDCLLQVNNPFTLTRMAAKRARQLTRGAAAMLPWGDHKSTVLALQEIAGGHVTVDVLDEIELPAPEPVKLDIDASDPDAR